MTPDEEDGDEPQENEEPREEGETDMEINVTDKVETAEEKAEDEALPVEDKKETDLQPEAEEKKSETEVKVDQRVVEMEVDEKVEATNDGEETGKTATVEESKEDEEGRAEVSWGFSDCRSNCRLFFFHVRFLRELFLLSCRKLLRRKRRLNKNKLHRSVPRHLVCRFFSFVLCIILHISSSGVSLIQFQFFSCSIILSTQILYFTFLPEL